MKTQESKKKVWTKPVVNALSIKKDTFSGSGYGAEDPTRTIPYKKK